MIINSCEEDVLQMVSQHKFDKETLENPELLEEAIEEMAINLLLNTVKKEKDISTAMVLENKQLKIRYKDLEA